MEVTLSKLYLAIKVTDIIKKTSGLTEDFLDKRNTIVNEIRRRCSISMNKSFNEINEELALDWLESLEMIPLLNSLIQKQLDSYAKSEDGKKQNLFAYKNMKPLLDIIRDQIVSLSTEMLEYQDSEVILPLISDDEYNSMVEDILREIDPTLDWLSIYKKAKLQGKILDLNLDKEKLKDIFKNLSEEEVPNYWECLVLENNLYIITVKNGTILDVCFTVHELAHYIALYNGGLGYNILDEFPSIFYEIYALNYLLKKGYKQSEIDSIYYFTRVKDTIKNGNDAYEYLSYFLSYLKNDGIKLECEIEKIRKINEMINNSLSDDFKKTFTKDFPDFFNPNKSVRKAINKLIEDLLTGLVLDRKCFVYVLGYFLASKVSQNIEGLNKMKWWTNNLYNIDPYKVFIALGCDSEEFIPESSVVRKLAKEEN